jgi:hypothetical protein
MTTMTTCTIKKFIQSGSVDDENCYKLVECKVGDVVCFKSDYEQCGRIEKIEKVNTGWKPRVQLTLFRADGFGGDYLRYATKTVVDADDCWL